MQKKLLILAIAASFINNAEAAMIKQVSFKSNNQNLAGNLYLPDNYKSGEKLPAVVITGAWTSVKEQMPAVYAEKLANKGYAALTFDFRGWGQSEGKIKYLEDPTRKTQDINAAINYLITRPEVNSKQVAGLGICASAGYMSDAAAENPNIQALALVAPWLHNKAIVEEVYGGQKGVEDLITLAQKSKKSEKPIYIEAASTINDKSLMYQAPYYTEKGRGLIPEYDNVFNVSSWEGWLNYDAIKTAAKQNKPTLLVHSEQAAIPQGAKEYEKQANDNVKLIMLDNITQFDFYDQDNAVNESVDYVTNHFSNQLDKAELKNIVKKVGSLADEHRFDELELLYNDTVLVDYSSLTGLSAEIKTNKQLINQWKEFLPNFDKTIHNLSNIKIRINDNSAIVTADISAEHYLKDMFWQVNGNYQYFLIKTNGIWKINKHILNLESENGTREIINEATKKI